MTDDKKWCIEVNRESCVGSGLCSAIAADHFVLVDGVSSATSEPIEPDDRALVAAESCPVEAILVREAAAGKVIAP